MSDAATRRQGILDNIASAARLARRPADGATLIAVSKTRSADEIEALVAAGQRHFGEKPRARRQLKKWASIRRPA